MIIRNHLAPAREQTTQGWQSPCLLPVASLNYKPSRKGRQASPQFPHQQGRLAGRVFVVLLFNYHGMHEQPSE